MVYSFGPFQLDARSRRLVRDGEPVPVRDRHADILLQLLSRPGEVVSKDALIEAAWKDVAVTDNSLEQAISNLRRTLGVAAAGGRYIETVARRGYRFGVPVIATASRHSDEALQALLAPHRAFIEGRAALETLDREAVARACGVFEEITRVSPDYAPAHLGLANALALHLESLRSESTRDESVLARALCHASEACRLEPASGEAWATLGLLYHQSHDGERAVAAARRATALEPDNWRHHLRLAYAGWGEERLRAAHRVLKLLPRFPFAHWLAATVHIARQAFVDAEQELRAGAEAQDRQPEGAPFNAIGLHLLLGLVRLAAGDERSALERFARELALNTTAHIYTREVRANTWCAIGAVRLRQMQPEAAVAAFDHAIEAVSGHAVAIAARAAAAGVISGSHSRAALDGRLTALGARGALVEAALAEAVYETGVGHPERAAHVVLAALQAAPGGSAGWAVPVDPLLHVNAHLKLWEIPLAVLRSRAL